jgi:hypothetical protein
MNNNYYSTQNDLLLSTLVQYYSSNNNIYLQKMLKIITGESSITLRIVDWFVTNYSKKFFVTYNVEDTDSFGKDVVYKRFNVYVDYKLKLKAYSKKRFDPFCRWERITLPYDKDKKTSIETTIGQLNFFKWCFKNKIIEYIEKNYDVIEMDMNSRNSTSKKKNQPVLNSDNSKTRKKREELSVSASKSIKKEKVEIVVSFSNYNSLLSSDKQEQEDRKEENYEVKEE